MVLLCYIYKILNWSQNNASTNLHKMIYMIQSIKYLLIQSFVTIERIYRPSGI